MANEFLEKCNRIIHQFDKTFTDKYCRQHPNDLKISIENELRSQLTTLFNNSNIEQSKKIFHQLAKIFHSDKVSAQKSFLTVLKKNNLGDLPMQLLNETWGKKVEDIENPPANKMNSTQNAQCSPLLNQNLNPHHPLYWLHKKMLTCFLEIESSMETIQKNHDLDEDKKKKETHYLILSQIEKHFPALYKYQEYPFVTQHVIFFIQTLVNIILLTSFVTLMLMNVILHLIEINAVHPILFALTKGNYLNYDVSVLNMKIFLHGRVDRLDDFSDQELQEQFWVLRARKVEDQHHFLSSLSINLENYTDAQKDILFKYYYIINSKHYNANQFPINDLSVSNLFDNIDKQQDVQSFYVKIRQLEIQHDADMFAGYLSIYAKLNSIICGMKDIWQNDKDAWGWKVLMTLGLIMMAPVFLTLYAVRQILNEMYLVLALLKCSVVELLNLPLTIFAAIQSCFSGHESSESINIEKNDLPLIMGFRA